MTWPTTNAHGMYCVDDDFPGLVLYRAAAGSSFLELRILEVAPGKFSYAVDRTCGCGNYHSSSFGLSDRGLLDSPDEAIAIARELGLNHFDASKMRDSCATDTQRAEAREITNLLERGWPSMRDEQLTLF